LDYLIFDNQTIDGHASVFLFDVGIVVFVIGSAAGKAYGLLTMSEMAQQVIIEELTTVVGIKAQERKRKHFFYVFDLFQDALSPLPQAALCSVHPVAISTKSMV